MNEDIIELVAKFLYAVLILIDIVIAIFLFNISGSKKNDEISDEIDLPIDAEKQKNSDEITKHTAIHTAGHAVISSMLGYKIEYVKMIYEGGDVSGVTKYSLRNDEFMDEKNMKNLVVIAYAGPIAEKIILGKVSFDNNLNEFSDFEKAEIIIKKIILESEEYKGYVARGQVFDEMMNTISIELFAEAEKMVRENLDCIKKVADQLVENNNLEGEQFKKIIEIR